MIDVEKGLGFFKKIPHVNFLGIDYEGVNGNEVMLRMPYSEMIVGNPDTGVIHGGSITTLLDTCCGFAMSWARGKIEPNPTLDLRIDHMTAATAKRDIIGKAEVFRMTSNIVFIRGEAVEDITGTVLAHAIATFMIVKHKGISA
jgi:uncharacterized protein (TIGR00369 family)